MKPVTESITKSVTEQLHILPDSVNRQSPDHSIDKLLKDQIVDQGPECLDAVILSGRMDPIGEQDHFELALRVNPQRGPGIAQVAERKR